MAFFFLIIILLSFCAWAKTDLLVSDIYIKYGPHCGYGQMNKAPFFFSFYIISVLVFRILVLLFLSFFPFSSHCCYSLLLTTLDTPGLIWVFIRRDEKKKVFLIFFFVPFLFLLLYPVCIFVLSIFSISAFILSFY